MSGKASIFVIDFFMPDTVYQPCWDVFWSVLTLANPYTSAPYKLWVIPASTRTDCGVLETSVASGASDTSENEERNKTLLWLNSVNYNSAVYAQNADANFRRILQWWPSAVPEHVKCRQTIQEGLVELNWLCINWKIVVKWRLGIAQMGSMITWIWARVFPSP